MCLQCWNAEYGTPRHGYRQTNTRACALSRLFAGVRRHAEGEQTEQVEPDVTVTSQWCQWRGWARRRARWCWRRSRRRADWCAVRRWRPGRRTDQSDRRRHDARRSSTAATTRRSTRSWTRPPRCDWPRCPPAGHTTLHGLVRQPASSVHQNVGHCPVAGSQCQDARLIAKSSYIIICILWESWYIPGKQDLPGCGVFSAVFTSPAGTVTKYCNEYVCVSVCLSVREDMSGTTCAIFTKFLVHVAYRRGSVLLRRRCDTLCTSGCVDDIMFFFYNGPYSGMTFATKNQCRLNLLIYRNIGENSISYY